MSLFCSTDLNRARARIKQHAWAMDIFTAVRARADAWLANPANVPTRAGGWIHDYVCPDHWNALAFDPDSPQMHRCLFGEMRAGEKPDAAWRVAEHRRIANVARDLALVYALTDDCQYADAACEILMQYARAYRNYAGASDAREWMLRGRVFNQALTEALWAVPIIHSYDLIRRSLAQEQDAKIVERLLRPLGETMTIAQDELVYRQKNLKSNYNAWLMAVLGLLGYALGDDALVERACDSFRAHLAAAILPDGFEYEGTPYYHNFVALAHSILAEAARANGRDLYAERAPQGQSIESMWRAFASLAFADGSIPAINDGAYYFGGPFDSEICETFEIAFARTRAPEFAWLIRQHSGNKRDTWAGLLFGEQDIADARTPRRASICFSDVGIAVLRAEASAQEICVPFGAHAGSHSHLDRLAPQIFPFATDAGTPLYGVESRVKWFQQTAAHNAIVVDGKSQAQCAGQLKNFDTTTLQLSADDAFLGVRFSRAVTLTHGALTDSVVLDSDSEHTFDWIIHIDGECEFDNVSLAPAAGKLANAGAYQYVEVVARGTPSDQSFGLIIGKFHLTLTCDTPFEIILAHSPAHVRTPTQPRQMILARTRARSAKFLATNEQVQ